MFDRQLDIGLGELFILDDFDLVDQRTQRRVPQMLVVERARRNSAIHQGSGDDVRDAVIGGFAGVRVPAVFTGADAFLRFLVDLDGNFFHRRKITQGRDVFGRQHAGDCRAAAGARLDQRMFDLERRAVTTERNVDVVARNIRAPAALPFERQMRAFHTGARKDCGKYTRTTGVTRGHCLVHRIMSHAHLTQNDVGHRRHRNALRKLVV